MRLMRKLRAELHWLARGFTPLRCGKCGRRRWTEEIIVNHGWCDRCFDADFDAYMKGRP